MIHEIGQDNSLLSLERLLVRLELIKTKLAKSNENIAETIISLLAIMEKREDYCLQFIHGGVLQGFKWSSAKILSLCYRLLALIRENSPQEVVTQEKSSLLTALDSCIDDLKMELEFGAKMDSLSLLTLKLRPPSWLRAPLYFVSYAHKDAAVKEMLAILIHKIGFEVKIWIDELDLERFHEIPKELSTAMKRAKAAILFLSNNYFQSKWCNKEWQALFMKRFHEKPLFRLYLVKTDESPTNDWPALLQPYKYTDCSNYPSPEAKVELGKLAEGIISYEQWSRWERSRKRAKQMRHRDLPKPS